MPCCGNRRARAAGVASSPIREPLPRFVVTAVPAPPVMFEYTGKTALAVKGPITRVNYRFSEPGARVRVDASDAPGLAAVPNVRRVTS